MKENLKIILVGSGNVAHHLELALRDAGHRIVQVLGRNKEKTRILAKNLSADFTVDFGKLKKTADLIILAASDNALSELAGKIDPGKALVVHTSGSVPMDVLSALHNYGVLYPLQTFSKDRLVDFSEIPVFVEANSEKNVRVLKNLALQLSPKVEICDSEHRKYLHLAAVFANNFSNHMYVIAACLLEKHGLNFEYLAPLILETAQKAIDKKPRNAQTGPALRNDQNIIDEHLTLLTDHPEYQKIYSFVSQSILEYSKGEKGNGPAFIQGDNKGDDIK
jgi:predicted short-subunit dehydrogenase-like oxidoreductase (DUF2520 family)